MRDEKKSVGAGVEPRTSHTQCDVFVQGAMGTTLVPMNMRSNEKKLFRQEGRHPALHISRRVGTSVSEGDFDGNLPK